MKLNILKPRQSLNKAFLKVKPNRTEIESFKQNLAKLIDHINEAETEEFHKNIVSTFLKDTYYKENHFINTKGRNDLVIHNGKDAKSTVGVIIEAKKPTNKAEMLKTDNINTKAFQELVLYYLRERITGKNLDVKYLIATNIYEWFIFDAQLFDKLFTHNKAFVNQFNDFEENRLSIHKTESFYKEIAEPFINEIKTEITFTHFDIREFNSIIRNADKHDDSKLITLYKLLSPEHLLKLPFVNDSNSLDKRFYSELLHIIGLTETKEGSKKLIERKKEGERNTGSLIENAIIQLDSLDKLSRLEKPYSFGETNKERLFNVALELAITWVNRILFLKLLEAQLISYHKGDKSYSFLNIEKVKNYDDLNNLFFQVLARIPSERNSEVKTVFAKVPYLNSSLFEPTPVEHSCLFISQLSDKKLPILSTTVLKDSMGKKRTGEIDSLEYFFEFLDAYDFTSEGQEEIQEDNKTLINASVLGLIFEKINGYKDGSFFTPSFITMYMCRETIRRAVVQKFNEVKGWECKTIDDLYNKIDDNAEANRIINSIKICDPAVGSGHFLVSALNEIIAVKSELRVLLDRNGKRLKEYHVEVENDELMITDEDGEFLEYNPRNPESQRVQETLFHEKQTIIESCLFGVDINPNSVKICRLRLWIELLKNAYYKESGELETLPNIDINIKCGNSLISRYALDADIKAALKRSKWSIDSYRIAVMSYRNAQTKDEKRAMERLIDQIKSDFVGEIAANDKLLIKLSKAKGELLTLTTQTTLFDRTKAEKAAWEKQVKALTETVKNLETELEEIRNSKIYENAFEWRFEFPEVLNNEGDFVGFDVVIGNPPWGASLSKEQKDFLKIRFDKIDSSTPNTYAYFIGLSFKISHSFITQILPDSILVKDFEKTRCLCMNGLYNLSWYQNTAIPDTFRPFIDVEHDVCILFIDKINSSEKSKIYTRFYNNSELIENERISHKTNFILKEYDSTYNILLTTEDICILNKLRGFQTLDNFLQCHEGIHSGNIREKLFLRTKTTGDEKSMFLGAKNGDRIENYISFVSGWYVDYRESIIDKAKGEYASLRDVNIFNKPKIYLTRTGNPFKAFIDEYNYASNNFFSIQFKNYKLNSIDNLLPILGLLNSKFANYYIRRIIAPSLGNTFVETKIIHLLKLPFSPMLFESIELKKIMSDLIAIKTNNRDSDITHLVFKIDQLVYQLYDLTEDEIKIIESC